MLVPNLSSSDRSQNERTIVAQILNLQALRFRLPPPEAPDHRLLMTDVRLD